MPLILRGLCLALLLSLPLIAQEPPNETPAAPDKLSQCEANLAVLEDRVMVEMAESGRWKAAYAETLAQLRKLQREAERKTNPPAAAVK